jgi:hypothetical protein
MLEHSLWIGKGYNPFLERLYFLARLQILDVEDALPSRTGVLQEFGDPPKKRELRNCRTNDSLPIYV